MACVIAGNFLAMSTQECTRVTTMNVAKNRYLITHPTACKTFKAVFQRNHLRILKKFYTVKTTAKRHEKVHVSRGPAVTFSFHRSMCSWVAPLHTCKKLFPLWIWEEIVEGQEKMANDGAIFNFSSFEKIFPKLAVWDGVSTSWDEILSINNQKKGKVFHSSTTYSATPFLLMNNWYLSLWSICRRLTFGSGSFVCEMAAISVSVPESVQYVHLQLIDGLMDWLITVGLFAKVPLTKQFFSRRTSLSLPWYLTSLSQSGDPIDCFEYKTRTWPC